jgi:hypothetical protein
MIERVVCDFEEFLDGPARLFVGGAGRRLVFGEFRLDLRHTLIINILMIDK